MGAFDKIKGQKRAVDRLQRSILAGRVSHAWLFVGDSPGTLNELAMAFAMTLLCTGRSRQDADACMTCKSCRQAVSGNQPDLKTFVRSKPKTFSVEDARNLAADIQIRPFASERKIYIVPEAHLMNTESQNALLKTLEEPPDYAVILLLSNSADVMLETIRSRCVTVELAAGDADYDPALDELGQNILTGIGSWGMLEIRGAIQGLNTDHIPSGPLLEMFTSWFRDVMFFKATHDPNGLLFQNQLSEIHRQASLMSYEGIREVLRAISTARVRLKANVGFELTFELLLLTMRDNLAG